MTSTWLDGPIRLAAWLSRTALRVPAPVLARAAPWAAPHMHGLDPQARLALGLHARLGATPPHRRELRTARRDMELASRLLAPPDSPDIATHDFVLSTSLGPIKARSYRRRGAPTPAPALVYYHGGGFVLGSLASHDGICRMLAHESGGAVIAIDYRLAPEHPFPAAVDDALQAFRAVARDAVSLGLDPRRLALGGDSAGGNLATVVALDTRADAVRPMFQLLIYPAVDLTRTFPSIERLGHGWFLERETLDWFAHYYLPDEADQRHPRASPWYEPDLGGSPAAFVMTAGFDPLVDEGDAWAERLRAAGVPTTHRRHDTLFHGFASVTGGIQSARRAMSEAAHALAAAWRMVG